jgi:hypothetical protein
MVLDVLFRLEEARVEAGIRSVPGEYPLVLAILRLGVLVLNAEEDCRIPCNVVHDACLVELAKDQGMG